MVSTFPELVSDVRGGSSARSGICFALCAASPKSAKLPSVTTGVLERDLLGKFKTGRGSGGSRDAAWDPREMDCSKMENARFVLGHVSPGLLSRMDEGMRFLAPLDRGPCINFHPCGMFRLREEVREDKVGVLAYANCFE